jgi:hypothetical protein
MSDLILRAKLGESHETDGPPQPRPEDRCDDQRDGRDAGARAMALRWIPSLTPLVLSL